MSQDDSAALELGFFDRLAVAVHGPLAARRELAALWQPFEAPPGPPAGEPDRPVRAAVVAAGTTADALAPTTAELNRLAVAHCPHPAIHAAVVATAEGAVAVPAPSGLGKSTLAAAACRLGAGYVSDEALVLAPDPALAGEGELLGPVGLDGRDATVLPYRKPVALSPWSLRAVGLPAGSPAARDAAGETLLAPGLVGRPGGPSRLGHLLLPERSSGPPALEPAGRPAGLAALVALGFNHHRWPRRFLVTAAAALAGARVHRLRLGDPEATARLVLDAFGAPPDAPA